MAGKHLCRFVQPAFRIEWPRRIVDECDVSLYNVSLIFENLTTCHCIHKFVRVANLSLQTSPALGKCEDWLLAQGVDRSGIRKIKFDHISELGVSCVTAICSARR